MDVRITQETAEGLVKTGIAVGTIETGFGPAVVRKAMLKSEVVLTITFPELQEKWVVEGGKLIATKYTPIGGEGTTLPPPISPKEATRLKTSEEAGVMNIKPSRRVKTIPSDKELKAEGKKEEMVKAAVAPGTVVIGEEVMLPDKPRKEKKKVDKRKEPRPTAPRHERPRTKAAKAKKQGVVKEQPPTKRARVGRPVDPKAKLKAVKGPGGRVRALRVPKQRPHAKSGKVPKVGAKAPVYRRQLGWDGRPEKIDINLYPIKVICADCGQPRYVDPKNAGIAKHPVTRCKPCQKRHKSRVHDANVKIKKLAARAAAEKAERKMIRDAMRAKVTPGGKMDPKREKAAFKGAKKAPSLPLKPRKVTDRVLARRAKRKADNVGLCVR